jgi:tetratricopeptide (TPR) repeat protein
MDKKLHKYKSFFVCLSLAIIILVVFQRVRRFEFTNYDDDDYITENVYVMHGLTAESVKWAFTTPHGETSYWHPLTWLSHMLDCELFGLDAGLHHLTNLLLHIANTLLLFTIFNRMTAAPWRSAFVAAAFALHPLHVESVAWLAERKDVLSTFFWMLTVAGYVSFVKRPNPVRYLITLLAFALGLMTKPMLVTLPFLLLLLDYWPLERLKNLKVFYRLILEKVPFFALSIISSTLTFVVQQKLGAVSNVSLVPPGVRLNNILISYVKYIGKMFWPHKLAVFYPLALHLDGRLILQGAAAFVLLLLISILVIYLAARHKYLLTGWLWYLGTLVPVIGLVQAGAQSHADRYTYVPLTGLFIIVVWGFAELAAKWRLPKILTAAFAPAVLLLLAISAWFQLGHWRNSITLFEHALSVTGGNAVVHNNLGIALSAMGRLDEAAGHYRKTLELAPGDIRAHNNLGIVLRTQNKFDEAIEQFRKGLQVKPDSPELHYNLGRAFSEQGRFDESVLHYYQALRTREDSAEVHYYLAEALQMQGRLDEAVTHYQNVLKIDSQNAEAHNSLGNALLSQRRFDEAISCFRRAIELKPDWPAPLTSAALILAAHSNVDVRNAEKAVELAELAAQLTNRRNAAVLNTLAVAYSAAGHLDQAISTAQEALELALSAQDEKLADYIRSKLELYKQKQP